jgi:flagellar basal-body rod protein FlgB
MADLFQATTIPVLEQVIQFTQARHTVLAGNIANIDTPGYVAKDLSVDDFQARLRDAIAEQKSPASPYSTGESGDQRQNAIGTAAESAKGILMHDASNVGAEYQVSEMVKNHLQHNTAISIIASQFRLLAAAISGNV